MNDHANAANAPLVSMVLPVYNGARYLVEALDSIFAQSFRDFELIAVDDCSRDDTPKILQDYADRHDNMRILTNRVNSKLPASLNNGFAEARGSLFTWTSDDNILHPDMLTELVKIAQEEPEKDIFHADYRIIDEHGHHRALVPAGTPADLLRVNAVGACFLYRRKVDEVLHGYDEKLFGIEDYDFWLRAMQAGFRFRPIHRELYFYRRHDQSLTDRRARHIQALATQALLPVVRSLPHAPQRASAYIHVACRDSVTLRWYLLGKAAREQPLSLFSHAGMIARWLKYALGLRVRGQIRADAE
ncbi:glycosyltransferase [Altericroceibacterium endophyticum]|uniref:glycosyltransferase n=1 Tax=Altericroceibacterium endophyticum TaxID=1808508 RepID=UPI0013681D33